MNSYSWHNFLRRDPCKIIKMNVMECNMLVGAGGNLIYCAKLKMIAPTRTSPTETLRAGKFSIVLKPNKQVDMDSGRLEVQLVRT